MSCQMSRAYRSEHDGHAVARRLLHRVRMWCCLPNSSLPAKRIGLAQNPDPSAVFHHVSKPRDVARRSICLTTTALSIPAGSPGNHGMKNSGPLNVLSSVAGVRIALQGSRCLDR